MILYNETTLKFLFKENGFNCYSKMFCLPEKKEGSVS